MSGGEGPTASRRRHGRPRCLETRVQQALSSFSVVKRCVHADVYALLNRHALSGESGVRRARRACHGRREVHFEVLVINIGVRALVFLHRLLGCCGHL